MKTRDGGWGRWAASGVVLVLSLGALACEEENKMQERIEQAKEKQQSARAAPPTPPAPAPELEAEKKTPTKKLEDCQEGAIVFDNDDIEAHIRMKAQKPEGDITPADLARITSVNFSRVQLDTLDTCVLSHMKNLKEFFLGPGTVWDISPLEPLDKLESVRLARNPIEDLSPLEGATNMDRLDISDTKIKDISVAENMTKLTEVTLDGSLVEDISPLANAAGLEVLSIKRTQVKSLDPLKESEKLEQVFIAESAIADDMAATGVLVKNGVKIETD